MWAESGGFKRQALDPPYTPMGMRGASHPPACRPRRRGSRGTGGHGGARPGQGRAERSGIRHEVA